MADKFLEDRTQVTAQGSSLSWPAKGKLRQALSDRLLLSEAIDAVAKMVDAYPNGRASITDSYIGSMANLLCQYPRLIALQCTDPARGVPRKTKFIPTIADVVEWCEPLTADMHKTVAHEDAIAVQLAEREEWERGPAERPKQTIEELRAEMRARGLNMGGPKGHTETPETVRAKLGLSQEEWDALPDADPGSWRRLMDKHAPEPR